MIILKKNGIFYKNEADLDENSIYQQIESVVPYLDDLIEIENNFTFRDFFLLVEPDEEMLNIVFSSYLGHLPLAPYISEIKQDCIPDGKEEMDYIECCWVSEQFDYRLFYKNHKNDSGSLPSELHKGLHEPDGDDVNEISIYVDVHGWGPYIQEKDDKSLKKKQHSVYSSYGIEFIPLHRLAHVPIRLNTNFVMRGKNKAQDGKSIVQGERYFTVFDIFGAIFSEISFCGLPEERNEIWSEIVDEMEKYNNDEDNERE